MSAKIIDTFARVRKPEASLAQLYAVPDNTPLYNAIHFLHKRFKENEFFGPTQAYDHTRAYLSHKLNVFNIYLQEYPMTRQDKESALVAWICESVVDSFDADALEYIEKNAFNILAYIGKDKERFPLLSNLEENIPLAYVSGLYLLERLNERTAFYQGKHRPPVHDMHDPMRDRDHAFRVLNDRPTRTTALTEACKTRAKNLVDALRGKTPTLYLWPQ